MFISILCLVMVAAAQQQIVCTPKLLLEDTLHDSLKLLQFNTTSQQSTSLYVYPFFNSLFTSSPQVLISLSGLQIDHFTKMNYVASASIANNSLMLLFKATNMSWKMVQVQFILHSRQDIYSQTNLINVYKANEQTAVEFAGKQDLAMNSSFIFINYILGVSCNQNTSVNFAVQAALISKSIYHIVVNASAVATFTVQTIYFSSSPTSFSYVYQQFQFKTSKQSQYRTIWPELAAVIYQLIGFSSLSFSGSSLLIDSALDSTGNLMQVSLSESVNQVKAIYLGIGPHPVDVCSPCDSIPSMDGCLPACPSNSYEYAFTNGGKICRKCQIELEQVINSSGNGCTCPNGQYYQGNCYDGATLPPACPVDTLLINNQCVNKDFSKASLICLDQHSYADLSLKQCFCYQDYELFNGSCLLLCPVGSNRQSRDGVCYCNAGYLMSAYNTCESVCPTNSIYLKQFSQCHCNTNYEMKNGNCVQCTTAEEYDISTGKCLAVVQGKVGTIQVICQLNQIVINGSCQCNVNSILSGGRCVACPASTYKLKSNNQCLSCSSYCQTCTSPSDCSLCKSGFTLVDQFCQQICGDGHLFILQCDDGNNINGDGCSSACQIQAGYKCSGGSSTAPDVCIQIGSSISPLTISLASYLPAYISSGIVIDFVINPPVKRSQSQIDNMFRYSFSDSSVRPNKIIVTQSRTNIRSYRCFLSYPNGLPNKPFTAKFDLSTGNDFATITVQFNTLKNPIKSAMHFINQLLS